LPSRSIFLRTVLPLAPPAGGTRLTFEHAGFTGLGGFLDKAFREMLAELDESAKLRAGNALKPRF
jgi:hypothetical protein